MKNDIRQYNQNFMNQKMMQNKLETENRQMKEEEYFPYIHGDLIEEQREIMNLHLGEELRNNYWEDQAIQGRMKLSRSMDQPNPTYPQNTDYPLFMKPHRQHYAWLIKDGDKEAVISSALKRHEQKLAQEAEKRWSEVDQFNS